MTAINIDDALYNQTFPILQHHGLTASQAVRLFFSQIAKTKTIPTFEDEKQVVQQVQPAVADNQLLALDNATLESLSGIRPFTDGKHTITNDMVNQIREQEGI